MQPTTRFTRSILPFLLALWVVGFAFVPAAQAGPTRYVDANHGFEIKLPSADWSQTPLQPGATVEVAKFKDDRQGDFATLSIYRFEREDPDAPAPTTTPSDDEAADEDEPAIPGLPEGLEIPEELRKQLEEAMKRAGMDAKKPTALDHLQRSVSRTYRWCGLEDHAIGDGKEVKFGKVKGRVFTFVVSHTKHRGTHHSTVAGIVAQGAEEYLIVFEYGHKLNTKNKSTWTRAIRSFRFPDKAKEAKTVDLEDRRRGKIDEDVVLLDPEKRAKVKAGLVDGWRFIDTRHYLIVYDCDDGLAKYIAKRLEYMRAYAFELVFPPPAPIEECMIVRICKEMDQYHHYGGPRGSAGYWASYQDELVFPDLARGKKPDPKTIGVMQHEAFHQFIYYALVKHNPPVWFNEGYAEYFYCVESGPRDKKLKLEKHHGMRWSTVKSSAGAGKLIPTKDFIKLTHAQYMKQATLCYAQGWAFATWLKSVTKNERYQQVPEIFFNEMQKGFLARAAEGGFPGRGRGGDPVSKAALEKAFEGIDLDEMHKDFVKGLKRWKVRAPKLKPVE